MYDQFWPQKSLGYGLEKIVFGTECPCFLAQNRSLKNTGFRWLKPHRETPQCVSIKHPGLGPQTLVEIPKRVDQKQPVLLVLNSGLQLGGLGLG